MKILKCGMCGGHVNYYCYGGFCSVKCANVAFRLIRAKMGKKHPILDGVKEVEYYDGDDYIYWGQSYGPQSTDGSNIQSASTTPYNGSKSYTTKRKIEVSKVFDGIENPTNELVLPEGFASFVSVESVPVSVSSETQTESKVDVTQKTDPKPRIYQMGVSSPHSDSVRLIPDFGDYFARIGRALGFGN